MKYWVYMNGEVPGCYTPQDLSGLQGFSMTTLVCPAEGEILEKNWRRSGEFPDIIKLLQERDSAKPPSVPAAALEPSAADVNLLLDTAGARLFSHVSGLMKELESRREERALTQSLQRQLVDLKEQLSAARERSAMLETRLPRLNELEEAARKTDEKVASLEASLRAREDGLAELRMQLEKARTDLDTSRRRLNESLGDLAIRNRLVDKLSRDLGEKELSLTKALGLIRRMEEELGRVTPVLPAEGDAPLAADSAPSAPPPPVDAPAPLESFKPTASAPLFNIAAAPAPSLPVAELPELPALAPLAAPAPEALKPAPLAAPAFTTDEPAMPSLPAAPPPTEAPAAQNALVDLFKKFISKDLHS